MRNAQRKKIDSMPIMHVRHQCSEYNFARSIFLILSVPKAGGGRLAAARRYSDR